MRLLLLLGRFRSSDTGVADPDPDTSYVANPLAYLRAAQTMNAIVGATCGAPKAGAKGALALAAGGPIAPRNASLLTALRPTTPQRLIGSRAFRL